MVQSGLKMENIYIRKKEYSKKGELEEEDDVNHQTRQVGSIIMRKQQPAGKQAVKPLGPYTSPITHHSTVEERKKTERKAGNVVGYLKQQQQQGGTASRWVRCEGSEDISKTASVSEAKVVGGTNVDSAVGPARLT
jgi:hypothetical protein